MKNRKERVENSVENDDMSAVDAATMKLMFTKMQQ